MGDTRSLRDAEGIGGRLTVVIPAYNAAATIAKAVKSALDQEGVDAKVIVVVDGDPGATADALADISGPITVEYNRAQLGASASRNRGLALVDTEFVLFLDADDFVMGPVFAGLVEQAIASKSDVAFAPMAFYNEVSRRTYYFRKPAFKSSDDLIWSWLVMDRYVATSGVLWRTSFLRRIGGWDERLAANDDGELAIRAVAMGAKFAVSSKGCAVYVQHDQPRISRSDSRFAQNLFAADVIAGLPAVGVSPLWMQRAVGAHYHLMAMYNWLEGHHDLSAKALRRSREHGFGLSAGPRSFQLLHTLLSKRGGTVIWSLLARLISSPATVFLMRRTLPLK
jgi:glycosyltransferase involved in cell wall biosynthesis